MDWNITANVITWVLSLSIALITVFYRLFTSVLDIKLELAKKVIEADFDKKIQKFDQDIRALELKLASARRKDQS